MNKYFYHFTHLDNLDSILKNGLLCTKVKEANNINHYDIANKTIQRRRSEMDVICDGENFGKIHDFVPFYFSTRNTMQLSIINQKKVDQSELIFLGVKTDLINNQNFIFTDSSANTNNAPKFYNKSADLANLNWDVINSSKWSFSDQERQQRMAEVLIKDFNFDYVDHIIVFNKEIRDKVEKIFKNNEFSDHPKLEYSGYENKHFYFTKFFFPDRKNEDLVTGPKELKETFERLTDETINKRSNIKKFNHKNIESLLYLINKKFDCIPELEGIFNLETINDMHSNTVSNHTIDVVQNLNKNDDYQQLDTRLKQILTLSAYLHDIGKGPKSKWKDEKQPVYNDHPYDSLIYTQRVLIEEIEDLNNEEIRLINLLVTYHDILGDLTRDHRNTTELRTVIKSQKELELLYILSQADVLALREDWYSNLCSKFEEIKNKVLK